MRPNLLPSRVPQRWNEAGIPPLSKEPKWCLRWLVAYRSAQTKMTYLRSRCAAVLVALFIENRISTVHSNSRSVSLRTYAGDTSLPGGKVEPQDKTIEDIARGETFQENKAPRLCILEPFLAAEFFFLVVLILHNTPLASLFSHPLISFLSTKPPFPSELDTLEALHQILTGREAGGINPVFGLTAAMLIRVATIRYAREPDFEAQSPNELSIEERIAWVSLNRKVFRDACEKESIDLRSAEKIVKREGKETIRLR
ncbi:hypothetical protein BYT27DRAFT_7225169 [Phlegmacium glaucopus]|nr:hypothetical protein BYT27DRAFT_7225169 [Phlegmacium glaucopus]